MVGAANGLFSGVEGASEEALSFSTALLSLAFNI